MTTKTIPMPPPNTHVLLEDGNFKKASALQPGDRVVTYDGEELVTSADFGIHISDGETFLGLKRR